MRIFANCISALTLLMFLICACSDRSVIDEDQDPYVIVLGVAQDAGFPQSGCTKSCCAEAWSDHSKRRMVSCLGIIDPTTLEGWIIDATPDFKDQLRLLNESRGLPGALPEGIFLTHAHIGHYTGLIHLGREAMGADAVPVFALPRMKNLLRNDGPWSLLDSFGHINLVEILPLQKVELNRNISITPFPVPHREELSEAVGFRIEGPNRSMIFIPDIDKWDRWDQNMIVLLEELDYALVDGTFFANGEVPGRDMSLIPHPFIEESMLLFQIMSAEDRRKVHFIHFNHTNPILRDDARERQIVIENGFNIALQGQILPL